VGKQINPLLQQKPSPALLNRRVVIQPMRTTLFISFSILLFSCTKSPEINLENLKDSWVQADTTFISKERLQIRIEKALEYIQTHRGYWGFPLNGCKELQTDTLREKSVSYRVALSPLKSASADYDISNNLFETWSCKVYEQPFDSLITKLSPSHGRYSKENNLLVGYSNETIESVSEWRRRNFKRLELITSSILKSLPSDMKSNQPALFEVPTGTSIRVHIPPPASNLTEDWDSLKYFPDQIIFDTWADIYAILFFNEQDEIEFVWWGGWES
jgi:hypothetical protein